MPMLVLLLLHAALSGVDAGAVDAGSPSQTGLAPMAHVQAQLLLRQDSLLQWENGQEGGSGRHALRLSHQVDGHWQLRHRISFGAAAPH